VLLTYFRFPLDDYLERAERKLSELPSMPPGQPRKEISTQRAVLLARLFQEHTRSPQWDLVAEIFGAFEEEVPGDTGKRVRRQAPARRDWSGPIGALMAEQMERDMLDREVKDFRARRGAKRRKGRRNTIKAD
jgi:hypothetical protein